MLTVACVLRSGGAFTPEWVHRLHRQVVEHINPGRFVALSDSWVEYRGGPSILMSAHHSMWPRWWAKLHLFEPGQFDGPVIYFDLDTLILKPIPDLEKKIVEAKSLLMLSDFYAPQRPASGVMAWVPCQETQRIYDTFAQDPERGMQTRHGDGGFIGQFPHQRLQKLFPGVFGSYKKDHLEAGPKDFSVCCFHGRPKQHQLPTTSWAYRHWFRSSPAPDRPSPAPPGLRPADGPKG